MAKTVLTLLDPIDNGRITELVFRSPRPSDFALLDRWERGRPNAGKVERGLWSIHILTRVPMSTLKELSGADFLSACSAACEVL